MTDAEYQAAATEQSEPQVLTTTTAAEPQPEQAPPADAPIEDHPASPPSDGSNQPTSYMPDTGRLAHHPGDAAVYADELAKFLSSITGATVVPGTVQGWFEAFGAGAQTRMWRTAAFEVANTTVPTSLEGDPELNLLDFRNEIAASLRKKAGL